LRGALKKMELIEQVRKLPVGIQSFEVLREKGYQYVDKTAMIYRLVTSEIPYFFSRPRRFEKSLLLSTFHACFEGGKDLFALGFSNDEERNIKRYLVK